MTDLPATRATQEPDFPDRERWKIVVQHEPPVDLAVDHLDLLLVVSGAEVRIYICAGGDIRNHFGHKKGAHEKTEKNNAKCLVYVDKNEIDWLYKTEDKEGKAGHNQAVYKRLAAMTSEIVGRTPSTQDATKLAPVILDADSEVPYEHIIGAVNACKEVDINNVEFVGNSKFNKYFGKGLAGGQ